jgi:hypothetical protein
MDTPNLARGCKCKRCINNRNLKAMWSKEADADLRAWLGIDSNTLVQPLVESISDELEDATT